MLPPGPAASGGNHFLGDWGSTRLRLWRLDGGNVAERREGPGIVGLGRPPAEVLLEHLAPWTDGTAASLTLCGMAGARGGLREVPYAPCPTGIAQWADAATGFTLDGVSILIGAGAACDRGDGHRDLMRGEETQVFGAMRIDPALASGRHVLVLPGTHSKWVTVEDGAIAGFRTFLTGELFARLHGSSLLPANSAASPEGDEPGDADDGFAAGLSAARRGESLLSDLFLTRTAQVDAGRSQAWAKGFLSGLLIGTECVAIAEAGASPVRIIGAPDLASRYVAALGYLGAAGQPLDSDACTLSGLRILHERH
jgi:2-dehydro-3-deoxygalactonokinase